MMDESTEAGASTTTPRSAREVSFWNDVDARIIGVECDVRIDSPSADAAARRAGEFRAGRACARAAIVQSRADVVDPAAVDPIAVDPAAVDPIAVDPIAVDPIAVDLIAVGPSGAPVWPAGIIGSISHSAGFAAAVVTRSTDILGLGIDIERARVFDPALTALVCSAGDQVDAAGAFGPSVAFGAKESVFKAWSPLTGGWLEFDDIRISLSADGRFDAVVLSAGLPRGAGWIGRWNLVDGIVRAVAVLTSEPPRRLLE